MSKPVHSFNPIFTSISPVTSKSAEISPPPPKKKKKKNSDFKF